MRPTYHKFANSQSFQPPPCLRSTPHSVPQADGTWTLHVSGHMSTVNCWKNTPLCLHPFQTYCRAKHLSCRGDPLSLHRRHQAYQRQLFPPTFILPRIQKCRRCYRRREPSNVIQYPHCLPTRYAITTSTLITAWFSTFSHRSHPYSPTIFPTCNTYTLTRAGSLPHAISFTIGRCRLPLVVKSDMGAVIHNRKTRLSVGSM